MSNEKQRQHVHDICKEIVLDISALLLRHRVADESKIFQIACKGKYSQIQKMLPCLSLATLKRTTATDIQAIVEPLFFFCLELRCLLYANLLYCPLVDGVHTSKSSAQCPLNYDSNDLIGAARWSTG